MDIPRGEICWMRCYSETGELRYIVTSTKMRDHYFLYEIQNGKLERVAKARTPASFDSKMRL